MERELCPLFEWIGNHCLVRVRPIADAGGGKQETRIADQVQSFRVGIFLDFAQRKDVVLKPMKPNWLLVSIVGATSLVSFLQAEEAIGAAVIGGGESVSYAVWNHRNDVELRDVSLDDGNGKVLAGGLGSTRPPIPVGSQGWRTGGSPQPIDAKHFVPNIAKVEWRVPATPGELQAQRVGPIEVAIRPRIPADVLQKIKSSRRYYLEIAVSAGVQPVLMRWKLIDTVPPPGQVGGRETQRGGDW